MGLGWEGPSEGSTAGTGILGGNSCISAGLAQRGLRQILGSGCCHSLPRTEGIECFNLF